jgi:hypothetical protein
MEGGVNPARPGIRVPGRISRLRPGWVLSPPSNVHGGHVEEESWEKGGLGEFGCQCRLSSPSIAWNNFHDQFFGACGSVCLWALKPCFFFSMAWFDFYFWSQIFSPQYSIWQLRKMQYGTAQSVQSLRLSYYSPFRTAQRASAIGNCWWNLHLQYPRLHYSWMLNRLIASRGVELESTLQLKNKDSSDEKSKLRQQVCDPHWDG